MKKNQVPKEYQLNPVDERFNCYQTYADITDPDNVENYSKFIDEAVNIFSKYKTQCNPKSKKLTLFANECNSFQNDNHAPGGRVCGDDKKWSRLC